MAAAAELTLFFDQTVTFYVRFSTFPLKLVRIGTIEKKWQQYFDIHDGGDRHLDFCCICSFDMTLTFEVRFTTFPSNLVSIGPIVKKWQPLVET